MEDLWFLFIILVLIVLSRDYYIGRSRRIGHRALIQIIEAYNITTVVIENRGWIYNRVSILHEGWKFTAWIRKKIKLPDKCDIIG